MSARHGDSHGKPHDGAEQFDHEIDVRGITQVGIWLAVTTVAAFAIVYATYGWLLRSEQRALDAKPSPIAEANRPQVVPGPRLQANPEAELKAFRTAETARLSGWGWVGAERSWAHVPIERAIDKVAADGLPDFAPAVEVPAQ
jgi:hypothetical protein